MNKQRAFAFYFHYNKPASKAAGKNILTVHYKGVCHLVEGIECEVSIKTRSRKTQPHCVIAGKGFIKFENNIAFIRGG